eukprot:2254075-Rhodomonas_salina.1
MLSTFRSSIALPCSRWPTTSSRCGSLLKFSRWRMTSASDDTDLGRFSTVTDVCQLPQAFIVTAYASITFHTTRWSEYNARSILSDFASVPFAQSNTALTEKVGQPLPIATAESLANSTS